MNFDFSDDQKALAEQARRFLEKECPSTAVRAVLENNLSHDAKLWQGVAEMGFLGVVVPEQYGGLGQSYLDLCVVAEEMGRALAPVPFSSSVFLATEFLLEAGTEAQKALWLPRLVTGEAIGTLAFTESAAPSHPHRFNWPPVAHPGAQSSPATRLRCPMVALRMWRWWLHAAAQAAALRVSRSIWSI